MDSLVALVGQLLSGLRSAAAPDLCPGVWAWATSLLGLGVGLLPAVGAFVVALLRRRMGSGYGGGRGLVLGAVGVVFAGVLPLLLFVATGRVFAAAAAGRPVPGLGSAAARSLETSACFVGPQSAYLGGGSVRAAFDPNDPVGLGVAVLLLGIVPVLTALFVAAQARLVLRRGPAWPAKFFWIPALALAVLTARVPAGAAEHLWAGALIGAFAGMLLLIAVPPPSRETVRRSLQGATGAASRGVPPQPRADLRERMQPIVQRTPPPAATGPKPTYATFDSARLPSAPPTPPVPEQRASAPLAAEPGALPPVPGRRPGGPVGPTGTRVAPVAGGGTAGPVAGGPVGPVAAGPSPAFAGVVPPPAPRGQRFRLIERIGAGGFGRVWLAHDAKLGRTVALKSAHAPDAETEERIRREAAALAAVRHPLCVRIHDLVHARSDAGLAQLEGLVIVMEHVQGVPLSTLVRERGPVDDVAAARIWAGVAGALDAAHQRGVLHRDLKPGNVIVDPAGHPHLIDFGIARRAGDSTLTMTGFVLGTPDYLAPEVAGGAKASVRSDVWQLAATVSFALTGYPPRGGHADALSGLRAAASGARLTHLPRRTAHLSLLKQALRSDPNRRPDLAATQQQLDEWLRRNGVPAAGTTVGAGSPRP
ncbi:serine/threonine-protein kinase [Pseudonocardia oroxyli]|uniref:non-specific serine/threonine protein kinase n=1 Tax=Pseudonocardia oroxyli TaxID=366584 RepID=A0A1G7DGK1_PSEOR|nr:serine/threonine-protein kinase [Pseudonocardia oroxyli]SDE50708.1 Serine/threonine protein kinase [Pseudonocardia oroxyli]